MKHSRIMLLVTLGSLLLSGCASSHSSSEQALEAAHSAFQKVKEDANVLRIAPKDVIRAGESLARADRLSSYWGSGADVVHYAYLSQRYSDIAEEHSALMLNEERIAKLLRETPGVEGIHQLRTRKLGDMIWVEVDLEMDGTLSIAQGHEIAVAARERVMAQEPVLDVMTHFDPVTPKR